MRVAIDTQSTLGRKTGIGQYTSKLVDAVRIAAPEHEFVELNLGKDIVMRTDRRLRWQQWQLVGRASRARAALLHVPGFDGPVRSAIPVVLTLHDLIGMLFPQNFPPVSRLYWSKWLPFTAQFARRIIADSDCTRRDIMRLLHIPAERICVIPLGVDARFQPQSNDAIRKVREQYSLQTEYILYVGTLEPRKGVDTLIDAFGRLDEGHAHELVIAGKKGWYWDAILKRIKPELAARVRVLEYVPDDSLPALYAGAAAFAFASRYEGFGLPVLEAMACGTPVVCADSSSLPEVAGDAARLVPADDPESLARALQELMHDRARADSLRHKGVERARQFTWEKTARATIRVYESLGQA